MTPCTTTSPACPTASCSWIALSAVANLRSADPSLRPTLMVIDLDRFKQVNDSVGIAVGDPILLTLARRLTRILKPQDTLARLAGDQFALILYRSTIRRASPRLPKPSARPSARRSPSTTARSSSPPPSGSRLPIRRRIVRRDHQGRRACDVSLQAHRRRPHRRLQAGDARAQDRPPDAGKRTAPRHRARGNQHALSADRAAGRPLDRRLRGAGALGSSQTRAIRRRNSSRSPRRSA